MPKKTKIDPAVSSPAGESKQAAAPTVAAAPKPQPKKRPAASKSVGSRKATAKKSGKASGAKKSPGKPAASVVEPSDAEIQLRAYFLSERRMQLSLPGDSANDWLEAKRQLTEEAAKRSA